MELKIGKSRGSDYLSIVHRYWDRHSKTARTRTIKSLGCLDDLKNTTAILWRTSAKLIAK